LGKLSGNKAAENGVAATTDAATLAAVAAEKAKLIAEEKIPPMPAVLPPDAPKSVAPHNALAIPPGLEVPPEVAKANEPYAAAAAAEPERKKRGRPPKGAAAKAEDNGLSLYVDCVVAGVQCADLEPWIATLMSDLAKRSGLDDVRLAGTDHALGYGRWRPHLAAAVQSNLPTGDCMLLDVDESEVRQVVVEALRPHCAVYVRGR
jgi:hypothetical protein